MGRRTGVIVGLLVGLLMGAPIAMAQTALRATTPLSEIDPADYLVLEPVSASLRDLASEVAAVLELRNGTVLIEVKEAVSSEGGTDSPEPGHIRIEADALCLTLTMGVVRGDPLELPLPLGRGEAMPDPRAVALAIETLRDPWLNDPEEQRARQQLAVEERDWLLDGIPPMELTEQSERALTEELLRFRPEERHGIQDTAGAEPGGVGDGTPAGERVSVSAAGLNGTAATDSASAFGPSVGNPGEPAQRETDDVPAKGHERRGPDNGTFASRGSVLANGSEGVERTTTRLSDEGLSVEHQLGRTMNLLEPVQPFVFARAYSGASIYSDLPQLGVATGAGLCAVGHCLVLSTELPVTNAAVQDLRYRYVTFLASFYSRPWTWSGFTPGASLGFLTRLGYFSQDMGLTTESELETDLAARASLELAWEAYKYVDLMVEGGVDMALDRIANGGEVMARQRGQLLSPWLQFAVRLRPAVN